MKSGRVSTESEPTNANIILSNPDIKEKSGSVNASTLPPNFSEGSIFRDERQNSDSDGYEEERNFGGEEYGSDEEEYQDYSPDDEDDAECIEEEEEEEKEEDIPRRKNSEKAFNKGYAM
jgi:hypothetical protein